MSGPERIWIETEPYDFPGYSPCWVWHGPEAVAEEGTDDLVAYVRADLAAPDTAEVIILAWARGLRTAAEWHKARADRFRAEAKRYRDAGVTDGSAEAAEHDALLHMESAGTFDALASGGPRMSSAQEELILRSRAPSVGEPGPDDDIDALIRRAMGEKPQEKPDE